MLLIKLETTDPYLNFAAEEYFLKNFKEDFFITGYYDESISIGVNQNTFAELNSMYVKKNNIKVVRRNSGGGAVFHDHGCLNFSFITKDDGEPIDSFEKYSQPIIDFLKEKLDLDAHFKSRNNILVGDKKISRIAKFRNNGRIVQHGAVLFSSNLKTLTNAIKNMTDDEGNPLILNDLPFTNLINLIDDKDITAERFKKMLFSHIKSLYSPSSIYEVTQEDIDNISAIAKEKYSSWKWNFGKLPDYDIKKQIICPCGKIEVYLKVEYGIIKDAKIFGNFFAENNIAELESILIGNKHKCDVLLKSINHIDIKKYFGDITKRFFIESLF